MYRGLRAFTAAALVASAFGIVPSFAQKSGGILRVHAIDSPPSRPPPTASCASGGALILQGAYTEKEPGSFRDAVEAFGAMD